MHSYGESMDLTTRLSFHQWRVSMVFKNTLARAFALLLSVCAPVIGLAQDVPARNPEGMTMVGGTIVRVSTSELVIKPRDGGDVVTVKLAQPFHLYGQMPSDLAHVKDTSFVGVTSIKQPDGTERATEIHVLPEEMRGVGEGGYMMNRGASSTNSRMTNGTASQSSTASQSRMSNGSVKHTGGSTLVIQYQGGVQNVAVPAHTPVTEFQITSKKLAAGDQVFMLAKKAPDGSLSSANAILAGK
jgi:hypothetical protein